MTEPSKEAREFILIKMRNVQSQIDIENHVAEREMSLGGWNYDHQKAIANLQGNFDLLKLEYERWL